LNRFTSNQHYSGGYFSKKTIGLKFSRKLGYQGEKSGCLSGDIVINS